MKDISFNKPFEYYGIWHFPSLDIGSFYGKVKFDFSQGIKFEIIDIEDKIPAMPISDGIIHGILTDGGIPMTVILRPDPPYRSFKHVDTKYLSGTDVFFGDHFNTSNDISFKCMILEVNHIDQWSNMRGVSYMNDGNQKYDFKFIKPESSKYILSENLSMKYDIHLTYQSSNKDRKFDISEKVHLYFESNESIPYLEWRSYCIKILHFYTLFLNQPVVPLKIIFNSELKTGNIVKYIYKFPDIDLLSIREYNQFPLVLPSQIEARFADVIGNWFVKSTQLEDIIELYNMGTYNSTLSISTEFILLTQALELFHKLFHNNKKHVDFKDRVKEMIQIYVKDYPLDSDIYKLPELIKDARNYYTHRVERNCVPKGMQLLPISRNVKNILSMAILSELGLTYVEIKNIMGGRMV